MRFPNKDTSSLRRGPNRASVEVFKMHFERFFVAFDIDFVIDNFSVFIPLFSLKLENPMTAGSLVESVEEKLKDSFRQALSSSNLLRF